MALSIQEAKEKYKDYIEAVDISYNELCAQGFEIQKSESFELGAEWKIEFNEVPVANAIWNVPHMLSFEPLVEQQLGAFEDDLIKDISMWRSLLADITSSISNTKSQLS